MLPAPHTALVLVALALALLIFRAVAWRIWQMVWPQSIRVRPATADEARAPEPVSQLAPTLAALGFSPLGAHVEKPRLGKATRSFDFAHPSERAFATAIPAGRTTALYFLSPLEAGGFVLTPVAPGGRDDALAEAWSTHRGRCQGRGRPGRYDAEERRSLARAWYSGEGKREIRRRHVPVLLWSLLALGMVIWAFFIHVHGVS